MNKIILSVLFFASAAYGSGPDWDGLRVTWSINPLSSWGFDGMPRTLGENQYGNFHPRDDQCKVANAKFLGQRLWYKQDPAVTLLYDTKGIIAGIQTSIPKSSYTPAATSAGRRYVDDGDYWTLTAYFVDPNIICAAGRTQAQFESQGTGTGLWLQTGPDPLKDSVKIPNSEEEIQKTKWTFGVCFPTMGDHYWYNVTKDMSCADLVPTCLMYNSGRLTAFCFATNVVLPSYRYEQASPLSSLVSISPMPDCFLKEPSFQSFSSLHIYLIDNPRSGSLC